ncbi:pseudouridine synthase deg1 [Cryptotrichosporon argae]
MRPSLATGGHVLRKKMARYAALSREELVARLEAYERAAASSSTAAPSAAAPPTSLLASASTSALPPAVELPIGADGERLRRKPKAPKVAKAGKAKAPKEFNFAAHATRHVALLVAYHGWPYSGLAIQPLSPYPTVEGELLKALEKTKLVEPGKGWDGCAFGRCGRTDRGVSGEGQVLNLWVRSARRESDGGEALGDAWRPPADSEQRTEAETEDGDAEGDATRGGVKSATARAPLAAPAEFHYTRLLNSVLPPAIRVLAWSPAPLAFDSRFSCAHRHYKYLFHVRPSPSSAALDLARMRAAAARLVGEHDFRNFCKLDGSKQIENHRRRVLDVFFDDNGDGTVTFNLVGTAFLWHQVRHVIAVLFLVGARLEDEAVVSDLLDVSRFPGKPNYAMGHPLPLTLHECAYDPAAGLDWRYGPYDGPLRALEPAQRAAVAEHAERGRADLERDLDAARQESEIRTWQTTGALRKLEQIYGPPVKRAGHSIAVPVGGGDLVLVRKYQKVADRQVGDTPEAVNRKWREMKAKRGAAAEVDAGDD